MTTTLNRRARVKAAEEETSVSALVRRFLIDFASSETEFERLKRQEQALREQIGSFCACDRLPREDVHSRTGK